MTSIVFGVTDNVSHSYENAQQKSDYEPGHYPAYLTPDGTWRFGGNAKKIADAAWANHKPPNGADR